MKPQHTPAVSIATLVLAGAALVGAAVGAMSTSASAVPSAARAAAAAADPFSGERNVVLAPVNSEGVLGLDRSMQATYAERQGRRNQFVLVATDGGYLIKTASLTLGGEPWCLRLRGADVGVTSCDAGKKNQVFSFRPATPSDGESTWTIRTTRNRYLVQNDAGGFDAAVIGEGTPAIDTAFLLVDKGESSLPVLG